MKLSNIRTVVTVDKAMRFDNSDLFPVIVKNVGVTSIGRESTVVTINKDKGSRKPVNFVVVSR